MESFGTKHIGSIKVERVSTVPRFSDLDIGRVVLAEDINCVYFGCMNGWIPVVGKSYITEDQLDLGSGINQLNANSFPFHDIDFFKDIGDTIEIVLKNIIDGSALSDESIMCRHVADNSILLSKLNIGLTDTTINSKTIPYYDKIKENKSITDAFIELEEKIPEIYNLSIDLIDWDYDINKKYFRKILYGYPFLNMPIVQCYDEFGKWYKDCDIVFDCADRLVSIIVEKTLKLNIVIIGS